MKHRTTAKLAVIVILTGCLIWILEMTTATVGRSRGRAARLLTMEPETIDYASFYRDGAFVECVNEDGKWFINRPVRDYADNSAIHRVFAIIESLPRKEVISMSEFEARDLALEDYGLAKPSAWLVLGRPGERRKLMIGGLSPLKDAVYVRLDNEQEVIATDTNVLSAVPTHADDLRDRRLLRSDPSYVTRLEIKFHDKPMLQLMREGAEWIIHKPTIARADLVKTTCLLECLFSTAIQQFVSENMTDPVAYGLGEDEAILKISLWQNGKPEGEKLIFGKAADELGETVYVNRQSSSSVFSVGMRVVENIAAATADLRDSRLYFMPADKVRFVSIEEGNDRELCVQKRDDGSWEIVRPQQWAADGRVVSDLVNRLNSLRITAFVDDPVTNAMSFDLETPARVIKMADHIPHAAGIDQGGEQLAGATPGRERSLRLSGVLPGRECVYAKFDDDSKIYEISAASAMTLATDPLKYRDPIALALAPSAVRSITLRKNGGEETVERAGGEEWKAVSPAGAKTNVEAIQDVLSKVASLGVSRFECSGAKNLAAYGLQPAPVSLTFNLAGESGISKSLLIGSLSEDLGVYAMIQGQDVVFVIERETAESLARSLTR